MTTILNLTHRFSSSKVALNHQHDAFEVTSWLRVGRVAQVLYRLVYKFNMMPWSCSLNQLTRCSRVAYVICSSGAPGHVQPYTCLCCSRLVDSPSASPFDHDQGCHVTLGVVRIQQLFNLIIRLKFKSESNTFFNQLLYPHCVNHYEI